ncbi:peptidylprolyl isomerase [Urechidicola vernalis]|uniref:Peptidyl-prolyl cis-trans isomerase n=1 Tax=Urechidicola vernalis TaxID=3075600 RepID=A0ABU2Y174_9FLAO|nr:peptidylprolyl isomerase [Urechidicola sp. P050]MDT0551757.1 peptidylprolyl isomerase [Urechidicola sp. P050]
MKSIYALLSLFAIFAISCSKPVKKKANPIIQIEETINEEVVEKRWDSLKHHNVVPFFETYGPMNKETKVKISTKFGDIKIRLYEDTPIHRANFIFLTKIRYFNTTVFYRVAPNFVIQGGNSDNMDTRRIRYNYGNYLLPPEFKKHRKHKYGALAAARDWERNPNKLSSPFEFYIIQNKNGGHHLDMEHTVFGEVYSGFSVMDKIANLDAGLDEWPKVDVYMKVEIID